MEAAVGRGITLDCEDLGDASAPAILLVMGLGMPGVAWPDPFVDGLVAGGFRVIRFDNRDCGRSTKLAGGSGRGLRVAIAQALLRRPVSAPYSLDDMAADAVGLLDALGIPRAHVVGVSMGGMIAQIVAARHPARVASLTSIMASTGNPGLRVTLGRPRALRAILARPQRGADARALVDGELACLRSEHGSLAVPVHRSDDVLPGTAVLLSNWWNGDFPGGTGVNALTGQELTDVGGAPRFHVRAHLSPV
jgi:pimeloyl-ACP methyl ester carboxylesterase